MKSIKFSDYVKVVRPNYIFLRLIPNNSIRNNNTHKLAKTIASLYKNITENVRKEESKVLKVLGREFLLGTKYSFEVNSKVSYMIYMEKKKIEFYFIIPERYLSLIKEKITSVWSSVTVEKVQELPRFEEPTQYQLVYQKEDALSLATDRKDNDLLNANLNIVDVLEEGDRAGVFYNFMPISQFTWRPKYESTIQKVKNNTPVERDKMGGVYLLKLVVSLLSSTVDSLGEAIAGEKKNSINPFEDLLERLNGDKISPSTVKKANSSILDTQIVVMSQSSDELRQRNNARSLTQSFSSVEGDNRLIAKSFRKEFNFTDFNIKTETNKMGDEEVQNFLSLPGRELLEKYDFMDRVETQETQVPEELRKGVMRIGTNTFRGKQQEAYLTTDKEYKQLTLVLIGPTRAGKSTLIGNLSYDAIKNDECVIVFDYIKNCELSEEVAALFADDQVLRIKCDDPNKLQGLGFNEVGFSADPFVQYDNAKKQTTQLLTLVNAINTNDTPFTPKMERYLSSASLVTFISGGSIREVFQVLQDHKVRSSFLKKVPETQKENLNEYILSLHELDEYDKKGEAVIGTKLSLIVGIIDRLNKLKANTYMELMLKRSTAGNMNLVDELQKNQLITIQMPEHMFATDGERDIYTTYWISKLWLALQVRGQKIKDRSKLRKVNLVIDELYQVKNTEIFLTEKLSRLAKFGLKPIISCHYLNQIKHIRDELRSANASYMLISGCDKNNFTELKDELQPYTVEDLLKLKRFHSMNLVKTKDGYGRFITKLPPPVGNSN